MYGMKNYRRNLVIISAAALLLRLIFVFETAFSGGGRNAMLTPSPLSDLHTYWRLSGEIISGTFSGEFYYQPFYYAVFLPLLRLVSGDSIIFVAVVQAVLGAATVYLAGICAGWIFSRGAGYVTAVLCALSSPLILYTPFLQNETLQIFNFALIFYLTLSSPRSGKWHWRTVMLGLWCAVAILTRGNAWLLVPGAAGYVIFARKSWKKGVAVVLLTVFFQLPFIFYNSWVKGELTGPSTAAAAVLALGNTPEAPPGGREFGLGAGAMEYPESYQIFMDKLPSRSAAGQIWDFFCSEPLAFIELELRKLMLVFDYREIPNNVSMTTEGAASIFLPVNIPGNAGIILALGLAGILLFFLRGGKRLALLYYFTGALTAGVVMFYVLARFRAVLLIFLAMFAGGVIDVLWGELRRRQVNRQRLLVIAGTVLAGIFVSFFLYDLYRYDYEYRVMRLVRPQGVNVDTGKGELMSLDNGPLSFGSWSPVPAEKGLRITKKWGISAAGGRAEITVLAETPGQIWLKSGGENLNFDFAGPGLQTISLPCLPDGSLDFEVIFAEGRLFFLRDLQRDYGRTQVNSEEYGELVAKRFVKMP